MKIKFRAWDKNENRYFIDGNAGKLGNLICCNDWDMFDPDDYVWEQFTGLKDANDMDIYAGDILHFGSMWFIEDECEPREEEHTGFVEYIPDYASYVVNCDDGVYTFKELMIFDGYSIQGNVHENPELLEEEK